MGNVLRQMSLIIASRTAQRRRPADYFLRGVDPSARFPGYPSFQLPHMSLDEAFIPSPPSDSSNSDSEPSPHVVRIAVSPEETPTQHPFLSPAEGFVPSPSDLGEDSSPPPLPVLLPVITTGDPPRLLRAVKFSARKGRWLDTSHTANGIKQPLPSWLRLVSWNVNALAEQPEQRLAAALAHLRESFQCIGPRQLPGPCCILLQEVALQAFLVITADEWVQRYFVVVPSSPGHWPYGAMYGNVTLVSRVVPVCNAYTVDFGCSQMGRNALFVDVMLSVPMSMDSVGLSGGMEKVRIANTHLESLPTGGEAREAQLFRIAESLMENDLLGGIVAGDMNAIGDTDVGLVERTGLTDAWGDGPGDSPDYTWGYQPPSEHPPGRLDKVLFTSRGLLSVDKPRRFGLDATVEGEWISDHYGLETTLRILSEAWLAEGHGW